MVKEKYSDIQHTAFLSTWWINSYLLPIFRSKVLSKEVIDTLNLFGLINHAWINKILNGWLVPTLYQPFFMIVYLSTHIRGCWFIDCNFRIWWCHNVWYIYIYIYILVQYCDKLCIHIWYAHVSIFMAGILQSILMKYSIR